MPDVVPNNDLKTISTASSNGQAAFTYDFTCDDLSEMAVYHLVASTEAVTKLTHTTDFTVVAGTVTLTATPAAQVVIGDKIIMQWEPVVSRASDYVKGGSFTAAAINAELSRIANLLLAIKRDVDTKLGGGVLFDGSFSIDLDQTPADLYSKFLQFSDSEDYKLVISDGLKFFPNSSDPPDPATGNNNDIAMVGSGGNKGQIYQKISGSWVDQSVNLTGPEGSIGPGGDGSGDFVGAGPGTTLVDSLIRSGNTSGTLGVPSPVLVDASGNMSGVNNLTMFGTLGIVGDMIGASTTAQTILSGGSTTILGGNFAAYAESHASKAGDWELRTAATLTLNYDHSAGYMIAGVKLRTDEALELKEDASPATPPAGYGRFFFDASGFPKSIDHDANVRDLSKQAIGIALGAEDDDIEVGSATVTFRMPYAMTDVEVRANFVTAPTGAAAQFDINESGTSILSTKLTVDAGAKTSTTAATPAVVSDGNLADDAEITIDTDAIGSTVAGAGAKIWLIGRRID